MVPACIPEWVQEAWRIRQDQTALAEAEEAEGKRAAREIAVRELREQLEPCLPKGIRVLGWGSRAWRKGPETYQAVAAARIELGDGIRVDILGPCPDGVKGLLRISAPGRWQPFKPFVCKPGETDQFLLALLEWYEAGLGAREDAPC